jgi:hypothetical protein
MEEEERGKKKREGRRNEREEEERGKKRDELMKYLVDHLSSDQRLMEAQRGKNEKVKGRKEGRKGW